MQESKEKRVCFMGDGTLDGAAGYLGAMMLHYGFEFDHIPSDQTPSADFLSQRYGLYIVSDYPSKQFTAGQMEHLVDSVKNYGSGLLMIGGWESFHGKSEEYNQSPLADALPVNMLNKDDRCNSSLPVMLIRTEPHPILADLPWNWPGTIGGYNQFTPKKGAKTLLRGVTVDVRILGEDVEDCEKIYNSEFDGHPIEEQATVSLSLGSSMAFRPVRYAPILVVGEYGRGRVAAYASDLAPHWSGGLVDWGTPRVSQVLPNGNEIEVGLWYSKFCRNLVQWTIKQ